MKIGFYRGDSMDIFRDGFDESKIETVLETEKDITNSDVLRINGKTYCVCRINHKHGFAEIDEIEIDEGEDKYYEDEITCPYCGHVHSDSYEYSDSEDEQECRQCGGVFSYERYVEVTYSSQPVNAPEIKSF